LVFGRRRREAKEGREEPQETSVRLRTMALDAVRAGLPEPAPDHPSVSGLVVDVPAEGGFATVVALTDGTTSMYTSTGGGIIGAGEHGQVAAATRALLTVVEAHSMTPVIAATQALISEMRTVSPD
jgi:hypothetical protein